MSSQAMTQAQLRAQHQHAAALLLSSPLHFYGNEDQMHCIEKQQPGMQQRACNL